MRRYAWDLLNNHQLGRYAEYYLKMEFTMFGFDVYTAEVDDHGIDCVIRTSAERYFDIQVKACRKLNYIFFTKDEFRPRPNLLAAVALFSPGKTPDLYLIPSTAWIEHPNDVLVSKDYGEGLKSKPEWGLRLSKKNLALLEPYAFDRMVSTLHPEGNQ